MEIKAWRKAHKMTQREMAVRLGVGLSTVVHWESGLAKPPDYLALALKELERGDTRWHKPMISATAAERCPHTGTLMEADGSAMTLTCPTPPLCPTTAS